MPMLDRIIESVQEAVDLLPAGSAGRARVEETRDYFTFIREDARALDRRWRGLARSLTSDRAGPIPLRPRVANGHVS